MRLFFFYKKFFITLLIIFFVFINPSKSNEANLFFADIDLIINKSNIGSKVINELEILNKNNLEKIKNIEIELKNKEDEIKKTKNIISESEFQQKVLSFNKEINSFNEFRNKLAIEFNSQKSKELNSLIEKINPIIEKYMSDNNITILLDKKNVFIGNKNRDITNNILEAINKNN